MGIRAKSMFVHDTSVACKGIKYFSVAGEGAQAKTLSH